MSILWFRFEKDFIPWYIFQLQSPRHSTTWGDLHFQNTSLCHKHHRVPKISPSVPFLVCRLCSRNQTLLKAAVGGAVLPGQLCSVTVQPRLGPCHHKKQALPLSQQREKQKGINLTGVPQLFCLLPLSCPLTQDHQTLPGALPCSSLTEQIFQWTFYLTPVLRVIKRKMRLKTALLKVKYCPEISPTAGGRFYCASAVLAVPRSCDLCYKYFLLKRNKPTQTNPKPNRKKVSFLWKC